MNSSNTNAQIDQGRRRLLDTATMGIAAAGAAIAVALVVWGGKAISAQDRYTLKIPDGGLAFSEFRGYETWQDVSVSQTETSLKVIAANDAMIKAYKDGVPGNGKLFPDGSKITKIEWSFKECVSLFRKCARHPENACVHRKGYQEIPEHARMGICPVGL